MPVGNSPFPILGRLVVTASNGDECPNVGFLGIYYKIVVLGEGSTFSVYLPGGRKR